MFLYSVESQVISIFAGVRGLFDTVELSKVLEIERRLLAYFTSFKAFVPYVSLLKEEFDDAVMTIILENFRDKQKIAR